MSESTRKSDARYTSLDGLEAIEEPKCGIGRCTPSWLQFFANPKVFVYLMLPTMILMISAITYTGAVLTTIEKEFQLSSTESGFLTVINDITGVVFVVFVSFLGHNAHRPRWIGTGIVITGVGLFICAFPHFAKDVFDLSTVNGDFEIPDFCFIRNFDLSKIPGFDPSKLPDGFDPSKLPEGFDPSKLPEGFDPSKLPEGFDPSKLPAGFDPSKIPDLTKLPNKTENVVDPQRNISSSTIDPSELPPVDPSKIPDLSKFPNNAGTGSNSGKQGNGSSIPFFPGGFPFASNFSPPSFEDDCDKGVGIGSTAWLIVGLILQGIGMSFVMPLALTYIDDSLPPHLTVFYAALLFLAISFGPIVGYMSSAVTLSKFVDFDRVDAESIPSLSQYDPRWIGAWWLGYIFIGTATIIIGFPFFLFPMKMPARFKESDDKKEGDVDTTFLQAIRSKPRSGKGIMNTVKEFFQAMKRLIVNPPLVSLCLATSSELAMMSILVAFVIKYVMTQFGVTPVTATIVIGSVIAPCSMLGNLFAGIFCRRFKLGPKKSSIFVICSVSITVCVLPALLFVGCDNPEVAGVTTHFGQTAKHVVGNDLTAFSKLPNLNAVCNSDCSCPEKMFLPVCGSDGVTYTSGCHAGCSEKSSSGEFNPFSSDTNYTGCTCISDPDSEDGHGRAVSGVCSYKCSTFPIYVILTAVITVVAGMKGAPLMSIALRIVADKDRSVAIGLQQFCTKVIGYFPAPLYFGALINSVCLLWQKTCDDEGACLMYDIEKYRYTYYGVLIGLKAISFVMFLIMYYTIKEKGDDQYTSVDREELGSPLPDLNGGGATEPLDNVNEAEIGV